jgi:hypothetical protein
MDERQAGATGQHLIEELASINKGLRDAARSARSIIPAAAPFELGLSAARLGA